LSVKILGRSEYDRRRYRLNHAGYQRWWSGLSVKQLGPTEYRRELRQLHRAVTAFFCGRFLTIQ